MILTKEYLFLYSLLTKFNITTKTSVKFSEGIAENISGSQHPVEYWPDTSRMWPTKWLIKGQTRFCHRNGCIPYHTLWAFIALPLSLACEWGEQVTNNLCSSSSLRTFLSSPSFTSRFQPVVGICLVPKSARFFFPFFRTTPFLLIPRGHMPHTLKRTSASPPHRRFKTFAPGVPGPHTEDINRISRTQNFAGASPSSTLKLNLYSCKLFHMAPITRLGKTSQLDLSQPKTSEQEPAEDDLNVFHVGEKDGQG